MSQGFGNSGVPLPGELRQQLMANPVAGEIQRGVRRIFPPRDATLAQEIENLRPLDLDQRPDNAAIRNRADGSQSGGAAAAQKAKEYGFGLIGSRMAERYPGRESALQVPRKKVSRPLRADLLQVAGGIGKIQFVKRKGKIERRGKTADKLGIAA